MQLSWQPSSGSHFIAEKTEAQRGSITYPRPHRPWCLSLEPALVTTSHRVRQLAQQLTGEGVCLCWSLLYLHPLKWCLVRNRCLFKYLLNEWLPHNSVGQELLLSPFDRWGNCGSSSISVTSGAGIEYGQLARGVGPTSLSRPLRVQGGIPDPSLL